MLDFLQILRLRICLREELKKKQKELMKKRVDLEKLHKKLSVLVKTPVKTQK